MKKTCNLIILAKRDYLDGGKHVQIIELTNNNTRMVVIKNKNIQYNIKHSVNISMNQAAESVKRSAKRILRWTFQMIEVLILSLNNSKSSIDCKGKNIEKSFIFPSFLGR